MGRTDLPVSTGTIKHKSQLAIFSLLAILSIWNIVGGSQAKKEESYNISVIIRGKMSESWSNLKRGAENAADDLNVTLRFVAAIEGDTPQEQTELLSKEAEGTDAILIAPVDSIYLKEPIQELLKNKKPVVLIESGLDGESSPPAILCDNEAMGKDLAYSIINHGNQKRKILIFTGSALCTSIVDRQEGFLEAMAKTKNQCDVIGGDCAVEKILNKLEKEKPGVAVALDTDVLEILVKASKTYRKNNPDDFYQVYGIGCSNEVLKGLENKDIVCIGAQDDFSIGYLGVSQAVASIRGEKTVGNRDIRYIITNSEQMYGDSNQRFLFPFVK